MFPELNINNFEITSTLGNGSSAIVYLAKNLEREKFVIKVAKNEKWNNSLKREIFILKYLNEIHCPYVPDFYQKFSIRELKTLVVNYYDGSYTFTEAKKYLVNRPIMFGKTLANLTRAIHFLHQHGIYHCDIKPDNILYIRHENKIVLIDFNISKINNDKVKFNLDESFRGSYPYMSPEFFNTIKNFDLLPGCDIWALGATIYRMLNYKPFYQLPETQVNCYSTFSHFYFSPVGEYERTAKYKIQNIHYKDVFVKTLMLRCLTHDYRVRPTAAELLRLIPERY